MDLHPRIVQRLLIIFILLVGLPKALAKSEDPDTILPDPTPIRFFAAGGFGIEDQKEYYPGGNVSNAPTLRRGYRQGFYLDNFDMYIAPDMGNRVRFLAEIALEPSYNDQAIGIDTERLQFGYTFSNYLTAWMGRFHTPLGYYVIAYHHAHQLSVGAEKPEFLDFEDHWGILPVHTTGLWLNGQVLTNFGRISYMAWGGNGDSFKIDDAGNGTSSVHLDMNMVHDDNRDVTLGGRLTYFFAGALDGLQIGASYMRQRIDYPGTSGVSTISNINSQFHSDFNVAVAHAVYDNHGFEFLNELFYFNNKNMDYTYSTNDAQAADLGYHVSYAFYTQLAYWVTDRIAPFVRFESANYNNLDLYFLAQTNGIPYMKSVIGARYNLSEQAAIKVEFSKKDLLRDTPSIPQGSVDQFHLQAAYSF